MACFIPTAISAPALTTLCAAFAASEVITIILHTRSYPKKTIPSKQSWDSNTRKAFQDRALRKQSRRAAQESNSREQFKRAIWETNPREQ